MDIREKIKSVLFVCTGNTCRSPMAMAILQKKLANNNISNIKVDSAGIYAMSGALASTNSIEILKEEYDIDISDYRTKQISKELLSDFDIIFTMGIQHKSLIENLFPELSSKIFLLSEIKDENLDLPDPFGHSKNYYKTTALAIDMYVSILAEKLKSVSDK